jgi:hypothetical protein
MSISPNLGHVLRQIVQDFFGFPGPKWYRVTITISDEDQPTSRSKLMATPLKNRQRATIDPDFMGERSGENKDIPVNWTLTPGTAGRLDTDLGEPGDQSRARLHVVSGEGGIEVVTWTAETPDGILTGSETFEIAAEGIVFAKTEVTVEDEPAAEV